MKFKGAVEGDRKITYECIRHAATVAYDSHGSMTAVRKQQDNDVRRILC